jgi:1-deoxy-D-xylulose-5-phosphate reductoisomerase
MKRLSVLGSTGSIGCNTLKIVRNFPDRFQIISLAAKTNVALMAQQIEQFKPKMAVMFDKRHAEQLRQAVPKNQQVEILFGHDGYLKAASQNDADMVVIAVVGSAGLLPTLAAIEEKKHIALANKETLVMAGELVMKKALNAGVNIFPIDSEHSAIFQCLEGHCKTDLNHILLTASGGPFLNWPKSKFERIKPEDALNHPTWQMGKKITIDSATLMNKGLEIIEAKWLFDVSFDQIQVVVHPQSIVHSMVAYCDGSIIAQLSKPDMIGAIAYALTYPERLKIDNSMLNLPSLGSLTFSTPDLDKFPCLSLAMEACRIGGTLPSVLNAANEKAVGFFLENKIRFIQIPKIIERVMDQHQAIHSPGLKEILESDQWARHIAEDVMDEQLKFSGIRG